MKLISKTFLYNTLILFRAWSIVFKAEAMLCASRFKCVHTLDMRLSNAQARSCDIKFNLLCVEISHVFMRACVLVIVRQIKISA